MNSINEFVNEFRVRSWVSINEFLINEFVGVRSWVSINEFRRLIGGAVNRLVLRLRRSELGDEFLFRLRRRGLNHL